MLYSQEDLFGRSPERNWMIKTQLVKRDITDESVLNSMLTVPRHYFVQEDQKEYAYYDSPLNIGEGQTISQPYIVAWMAQLLELASKDRVLEIGTGSGYSAAVLSRIASQVYTMERHEVLAERARDRFQTLDYKNIKVRLEDGTLGWPEEAPFDAILVTAGAPFIPEPLLEQLSIGGRLVIPVGKKGDQELIRVRKSLDNDFIHEHLGQVRFVSLIGAKGWSQ